MFVFTLSPNKHVFIEHVWDLVQPHFNIQITPIASALLTQHPFNAHMQRLLPPCDLEHEIHDSK